jgi:tryptophan synthase beta chain
MCIIPAPEANHAIAQVIREVEQAKIEGTKKTILFNLCGHGHLDMQAYQDYFDGKLQDHHLTEAELTGDLKKLEGLPTI